MSTCTVYINTWVYKILHRFTMFLDVDDFLTADLMALTAFSNKDNLIWSLFSPFWASANVNNILIKGQEKGSWPVKDRQWEREREGGEGGREGKGERERWYINILNNKLVLPTLSRKISSHHLTLIPHSCSNMLEQCPPCHTAPTHGEGPAESMQHWPVTSLPPPS